MLSRARKNLIEAKSWKRVLDVAIVEHALQLETVRDGSVDRSGGSATSFAAQHNLLHLEDVGADDVKAVTRRVRTGVAGVEERQQHAARFEHRPEPPNDRFYQTLIEIVGQVPAQDNVEASGRIDQVIGEKLAAIENNVSLLVLAEKFGISRGGEQVFAVDLWPVR